jgi:hypothetical protein
MTAFAVIACVAAFSYAFPASKKSKSIEFDDENQGSNKVALNKVMKNSSYARV